MAGLVAERLLARTRRVRRHRPRRLRRVTDDGPGRGTPAAANHPPLHRGEVVLRLVDEHVRVEVVLGTSRRPGSLRAAVADRGELRDVLVEQLRDRVVLGVAVVRRLLGDVPEEEAELVDQGHVLDGPVVGLHAIGRGLAHGPPRLRPQGLLVGAHHALADTGEQVRVAQPAEHLGRVQGRPPLENEVDERGGAEQDVVELVAAALTTALALHLPPHRVEQRGRHSRHLAVAPALRRAAAAANTGSGRACRARGCRRGRTLAARGVRPGTACRAVRRSSSAMRAEPFTAAMAGSS